MPTVQFDNFPDDEKADFLNICNQLGLDPGALIVTAERQDFPLHNGQYRIDRIVTVTRKATKDRPAEHLELDGATWPAEFAVKGGVLK